MAGIIILFSSNKTKVLRFCHVKALCLESRSSWASAELSRGAGSWDKGLNEFPDELLHSGFITDQSFPCTSPDVEETAAGVSLLSRILIRKQMWICNASEWALKPALNDKDGALPSHWKGKNNTGALHLTPWLLKVKASQSPSYWEGKMGHRLFLACFQLGSWNLLDTVKQSLFPEMGWLGKSYVLFKITVSPLGPQSP